MLFTVLFIVYFNGCVLTVQLARNYRYESCPVDLFDSSSPPAVPHCGLWTALRPVDVSATQTEATAWKPRKESIWWKRTLDTHIDGHDGHDL